MFFEPFLVILRGPSGLKNIMRLMFLQQGRSISSALARLSGTRLESRRPSQKCMCLALGSRWGWDVGWMGGQSLPLSILPPTFPSHAAATRDLVTPAALAFQDPEETGIYREGRNNLGGTLRKRFGRTNSDQY